MERFVNWLLVWLGGDLVELAQRDDYEKIRALAKKRLRGLPVVLCFIDDAGYTADAVRALYEHHHTTISSARLGSPENNAWVDISWAAKELPPTEQIALTLLSYGYTVTEIGRALGLNGSRFIMSACSQIAAQLEGQL